MSNIAKFRRGKFNVDEALDTMDMEFKNYMPSTEALEFFALIRVFMGEDFEVPNPKFHYFIVDMLFGLVKPEDFPYSAEIVEHIPINPGRIGIIASRGSAKSTITTTFYPIYCAIKGETPLIKNISHMLILSDSQQGGARDQAKLLAGEFEKSVFAQEYFEKMRFTESECELIRKGNTPVEKRHILIKFKGAQALSLDTKLYTDAGVTTMGEVQVGDKLFGADGKLCTVTKKSEVFYKDMYELVLKDGRTLKVSEDHINSILFKENNYKDGSAYRHLDVTTNELLQLPMWKENPKTGHKTPRLWIENIRPLDYTEKQLPIDPYTLGLYLGDGYYHAGDGSAKLTAHVDDIEFYLDNIPYEAGYKDYQNNCVTVTLKGLGKELKKEGLAGCKAPTKFIPEEYMYGSIEQRTELLRGLIDTDGTIAEGNRGSRFMSTSLELAEGVVALVRSLGGIAHIGKPDNGEHRKHTLYKVFIKCNIPVAKLPRKMSKLSLEQRAMKVAIVDIRKIDTVASQCIAVDNELRQYVAGEYTRTHNTGGIRSGSRNPVTRDRYAIILADDVIKNEAEAYSETIMHNVTTALTSDALNAMRGKNTQMVLVNTPFHSRDPVYKSLESGTFMPLVAPICKNISEELTRKEFEPLWDDMHNYDSVMERYLNAVGTNTTKSFNQELMLRVSSEEDRMITQEMLQPYDRKMLMGMLGGYSIYITTDFTTTSAAKSDFSAMGVWAISSNMDYYLLDLHVRKCELIDQYESLFRLVSTWSKGGKFIEVGVEVDGQQKAHIFALKEMMLKKNIHFSFARQKGATAGKIGILSRAAGGNKLERFRYMLPQFQNMKFYFPNELLNTPDMKEAMKQMKGATHSGFSGHDDWCDCVSQLGMMDILPGTGTEDIENAITDVSDDVWSSFDDGTKSGGGSTVF